MHELRGCRVYKFIYFFIYIYTCTNECVHMLVCVGVYIYICLYLHLHPFLTLILAITTLIFHVYVHIYNHVDIDIRVRVEGFGSRIGHQLRCHYGVWYSFWAVIPSWLSSWTLWVVSILVYFLRGIGLRPAGSTGLGVRSL